MLVDMLVERTVGSLAVLMVESLVDAMADKTVELTVVLMAGY
jgi:hypothetical protein